MPISKVCESGGRGDAPLADGRAADRLRPFARRRTSRDIDFDRFFFLKNIINATVCIGRATAPEWVGRTAACSKPLNKFFLPKLRTRSMFVPVPAEVAERIVGLLNRGVSVAGDRSARVPDGKTESPGNDAATA